MKNLDTTPTPKPFRVFMPLFVVCLRICDRLVLGLPRCGCCGYYHGCRVLGLVFARLRGWQPRGTRYMHHFVVASV